MGSDTGLSPTATVATGGIIGFGGSAYLSRFGVREHRLAVIGLIKIGEADRNEELLRIFDTPHAAVPAPNMLESPNEIIADIAQLEVDLREELRLFRSRISHEILQNRTLSGS